MPSLSELPGEIKRKKFIRALIRLGFQIDTKGGNGSHFKATWPRTQKSITIPGELPKQTLNYVLKEIELYSGITWEDIKKVL
jgi:predicted RNA binding protein YcfA (HicA-like mRNA interferase family)